MPGKDATTIAGKLQTLGRAEGSYGELRTAAENLNAQNVRLE